MREFLKELFIVMIGFACGVAIGYYHEAINANEKYELGYLDACKDFYKGKPKYDLVKNDNGTVVWKRVDK